MRAGCEREVEGGNFAAIALVGDGVWELMCGAVWLGYLLMEVCVGCSELVFESGVFWFCCSYNLGYPYCVAHVVILFILVILIILKWVNWENGWGWQKASFC